MFPPAGLEAVLQKMHQDYEDNPYSSPMGAQVQSGDDLQGILNGINAQYAPQHQFSDKLAELISQFPQRQPHTKMQEFMAGLASLHPSAMGIAGGQPIGYERGDPLKQAQAKDQILNSPFYDAMNDWQAKLKPVEAGAQDERYINTNLRQLLGTQGREAIAAKRAEDQARNIDSMTANRAITGEAATTRAGAAVTNAQSAADRAKAAGVFHLVDPTNGVEYTVDPKTSVATPVQKAGLSTLQGGAPMIQETPAQIAKRKADEALALQGSRNSGALAVQGSRNQGALDRVAAQERANELLVTAKAKAEVFKPTTQTRTMMEGAQMALPHLNDIQGEARELAKRNAFGPLMSRLREAAAKVGTTGDPEDINKSIQDYNTALTNYAAESNDTLVGQFASDLALMTTLMGRIHGGVRGGGSIQMMQYMKDVLTGTSSFAMFEGRMKTLRSYLQKYAAGPQPPPDTTDLKNKLKAILGPDTGGK